MAGGRAVRQSLAAAQGYRPVAFDQLRATAGCSVGRTEVQSGAGRYQKPIQ